jgi:hypothetical protein
MMQLVRAPLVTDPSSWKTYELGTYDTVRLPFDPQAKGYDHTAEYQYDQFQIIPSLRFLSRIDLRECAFSGSVDEFVGRIFHTRVAEPLSISFSFFWGYRYPAFQCFLFFSVVPPAMFRVVVYISQDYASSDGQCWGIGTTPKESHH